MVKSVYRFNPAVREYLFGVSFLENSPAPRLRGWETQCHKRIQVPFRDERSASKQTRFYRHARGLLIFLSLQPSVETLGYCQRKKTLKIYLRGNPLTTRSCASRSLATSTPISRRQKLSWPTL